MSDMIAAVATGWVRAGIGILRLSGGGCIEAAEAVFRAKSGKALRALPPGRLTLGTLFDEQARERGLAEEHLRADGLLGHSAPSRSKVTTKSVPS